MLPFVYRVTKYDPADRDSNGAYHGKLDHLSDKGPIEDAYVGTVRAFAEECGVRHLTIRNPEYHGDPPDLAPLSEADPLASLFGVHVEGYVDGAVVDLAGALSLVRLMLRGETWCRLEDAANFALHVGWDMYVYVGSAAPCPESVAAAARHGLFAERMDASPYDIELEPLDELRTVDDAFWSDVASLARSRGSVVILEEAAWPIWYSLPAGAPHPTPRPGARLSIWPAARDTPSVVYSRNPPRPDEYADEPTLRCVVAGPDGTVSARWPAS